jgi:hypothetical protein
MTPLDRLLVSALIALSVLGLGAAIRSTARQVVEHAIMAPIQAVAQ